MDDRTLDFLKQHERQIFGTPCEYCKPSFDYETGRLHKNELTACQCPPYSTFEEWKAIVFRKSKKKRHYGLRITKPSEMSESQFNLKLKNLSKYKWFKNFYYNIEYWSGEKELRRNCHSHLALEDINHKLYKHNFILTRLCKHFSYPDKSNMIQIWSQMSPLSHNNYINYIKGDKKGKCEAVLKDKETRKELGIRDYYTDLE